MADVRITSGFPAIVNEKAARVVAGLVGVVAGLALLTGWLWLGAALAVGFALRVASGPRLDPFGLLATRVIAPRFGRAVLVPGPPKRFAQAVGMVLTLVATVFLVAGQPVVTAALLGVLLVFASLEAVVGFCAGCYAFGLLMRVGVIPEETCAACTDISLRRTEAATAA